MATSSSKARFGKISPRIQLLCCGKALNTLVFAIPKKPSAARTELRNQLSSLEMNDGLGDAHRVARLDLLRLRGHFAMAITAVA